MTAPRVILPIEHIDGEDVEDADRTFISASDCLNCEKLHTSDYPIFFAHTAQGLIWWHRHHCNPNNHLL